MGAYIDGSRENLDLMDRMLLALEQNPSNLEAVEEIFRAAHTLKGMSGTMGFEKIAHLTHEMENILDKLRSKQMAVTPQIIDVIFETFDVLRTLVGDSISGTDSNVDLAVIQAKLQALASGGGAPPGEAPEQGEAGPSDVAVPAPPPGGGEGAQELADLPLSEFEVSGLMDSMQQGSNPYLLKVTLVPDCLLKGPRIFMVLRTLDSCHAEIIKAHPEVKDLENEKFERSFKMIVTCERPANEIVDGIESISEIEKAEVYLLTPDNFTGGGGGTLSPASPPAPPPPPPIAETQVAAPVQPQAPTTPVAAPPPARAPATATAPPQASPTPSPRQAAPVAPPAAPPVAPPSGSPPAGGDLPPAEEEKETVEIVQLVSFTMGSETYALDIRQVDGIINMHPITRVPKAPHYIEGVINLRGEIIPVLSLSKRLKLPETQRAPTNKIIILSFEKEKIKAGLLVEFVQKVLKLPSSLIEPPSHVSEGAASEYLGGVGKLDNRIIILLDAHRLVLDK